MPRSRIRCLTQPPDCTLHAVRACPPAPRLEGPHAWQQLLRALDTTWASWWTAALASGGCMLTFTTAAPVPICHLLLQRSLSPRPLLTELIDLEMLTLMSCLTAVTDCLHRWTSAAASTTAVLDPSFGSCFSGPRVCVGGRVSNPKLSHKLS